MRNRLTIFLLPSSFSTAFFRVSSRTIVLNMPPYAKRFGWWVETTIWAVGSSSNEIMLSTAAVSVPASAWNFLINDASATRLCMIKSLAIALRDSTWLTVSANFSGIDAVNAETSGSFIRSNLAKSAFTCGARPTTASGLDISLNQLDYLRGLCFFGLGYAVVWNFPELELFAKTHLEHLKRLHIVDRSV